MFLFVMNARRKRVALSLVAVLIAGLGVAIPVAAQTVVIEDGLIGYWSFDKDTVKGKTVADIWGNQDAEIIGDLQIVPGKFGEAVQLGGGAGARIQITDDIKKAELPTEEMTVELWVWDEQFIEWGGYMVAVQDNGAFEKGWLLGTRWKAFSFALSSEDADDGDGLLTYLNSGNSYDVNEWHHVVGTYDGKEMKIYVDGKLEGTSGVQSGPINYPDRVFFSMGAYKDDNEDFVLKGMLDEVRLYDRALSEKEVSNNLEAEGLAVDPAGKLSLTWGQIKAAAGR
ncbi:LamG domain-containing protein [Candidatus Poribacteria bacterium]|nr:LamG domain-containing protein [Candidatus Poribacteria bacterium]MYH82891.1 LamG domain-containing protein [Candidatus Poribacteria bacterium]MYK96374.1 LamG domain-containing protein [Candidatus Poribacteria bacterium]